MKWCGACKVNFQSSSENEDHVFMSSYSEVADTENTMSISHVLHACAHTHETAPLIHTKM